jgi:hypothetical protein
MSEMSLASARLDVVLKDILLAADLANKIKQGPYILILSVELLQTVGVHL